MALLFASMLAPPIAADSASPDTAGAPLEPGLEVAFAPGEGTRTAVRGVVVLPAAQAQLNRHGFYNLALTAEVLAGGRPYDRFAYRFDVPGGGEASAPLTLIFERALRPGTFDLELQVEDLQSGRIGRLRGELEVPRLAPAAASEPAANAAALTAAEPRPPIRLVPPPPVVRGKHRFEAIARDPRIAAVVFLLDGKRVLARTAPPYSVELDLGEEFSLRRVGVEALDGAGALVGSDEVEVNGGEGRFAVRLVEPPAAAQRAGRIVARVELEAPRGRRVERVELFVDERPVGVLRGAPWELPVTLAGTEPALLRAVAYLPGGTVAEGSLLLNAPHGDVIDVDLVELYTAVVDPRGRPVRGLDAGAFRVYEEGSPQRLERFEEVDDLPLHVALVLDTSTSMATRMPEVRAAAFEFLEQMVRPGDRVTLITFDDAPRVRVDFTDDLAFLGNGLEGLAANGGTALYDSLVFALEELRGIQGQRVVVLLSDGMDERSNATAGEVVELARRAAVTIYTLAVEDPRPNGPNLDRPLLQRLAAESGGSAFFVGGDRELRQAYARIEHEVRSRYLLAYYSSHRGDDGSFRLVDVKVKRPHLAARTIRGYYP